MSQFAISKKRKVSFKEDAIIQNRWANFCYYTVVQTKLNNNWFHFTTKFHFHCKICLEKKIHQSMCRYAMNTFNILSHLNYVLFQRRCNKSKSMSQFCNYFELKLNDNWIRFTAKFHFHCKICVEKKIHQSMCRYAPKG